MSDKYDDLEDDVEGEDIDEELETMPDLPEGLVAQPKMVVLVFTAAEEGKLADVTEDIIEGAENRGLWLVHASESDMDMDEVAHGTELWQACTGRNA